MSTLPHLPNLGLVQNPHEGLASTYEEPTPVLRFVRRHTGKTILQQKVIVRTTRGDILDTSKSEWRDVPMVEEDAA